MDTNEGEKFTDVDLTVATNEPSDWTLELSKKDQVSVVSARLAKRKAPVLNSHVRAGRRRLGA